MHYVWELQEPEHVLQAWCELQGHLNCVIGSAFGFNWALLCAWLNSLSNYGLF